MDDVKLDLDDDPAVKVLLTQFRKDVPGFATDNRLVQSSKDTGIPYLAICAIGNALAGSTIRVKLRNNSIRKSATAANQNQNDHELTDAPTDHPLCRLFTYINPNDTYEDFAMDTAIQYFTTGTAPLWFVPSKLGPACEIYVLKTALLMAVPISPPYPYGAWKVQQFFPSGAYGLFPSQQSSAGATIDARQVKRFRGRHPLWNWDGYSPLTAGGVQLDVLNAIDESRKAAMDHGFNPDAVVTIEGVNQETLNRTATSMNNTHGGARNARKIAFFNGKSVSVDKLSTAPKDMDYEKGWDQMVKYALALFGVPPGTAGIAEATSYAQLYASLRQFYSLKMQPFAKAFGAFLTKHVAEDIDKNAVIQIDVPDIDDKEMEQKKWEAAAMNGFVSRNQFVGATLSLPPEEGGDTIPAIQQAQQMQQQQDMAAQQAQEPQTPDDAVAHGVLGMLGVDPNEGDAGQPGQEQPEQQPVTKAMPGKFEETKHKRDHGKFSHSAGAGGPSKPVGTNPSGPGGIQTAKLRNPQNTAILGDAPLIDNKSAPTARARPITQPVPGLINHFNKLDSNTGDAKEWASGIKFPPQAVDAVKQAIAKTGQTADHLTQSTDWAVKAAKKYSQLVGKKLGKDPAKAERALFHMFVKMAQVAGTDVANAARASGNPRDVSSKVAGVGTFRLKQKTEPFKGRDSLAALFKSSPRLAAIFKGL